MTAGQFILLLACGYAGYTLARILDGRWRPIAWITRRRLWPWIIMALVLAFVLGGLATLHPMF